MTDDRETCPREGTHGPGGPPRQRERVYLIEDDPAERLRLVRLLEENGYEVLAVATLEAAVTESFWDGDPAKLLFVGRSGRGG